MPRAKNEYTAVAGAEKRLTELLKTGDVGGHLRADDQLIGTIVSDLTGGGATIEHKPRLKAIVITLPIPEPAPEPKLGKFQPVEVPEDYDPFPGEEALSE